MVKISLTSFLDYFIAAGTAKATQITKIRKQLSEDYEPKKDFYKLFRKAVLEYHSKGRDKQSLRDVKLLTAHAARHEHFEKLADSYIHWLGRKQINYFNIRSSMYEVPGLQIAVNPELGLEIKHCSYAVKLYFKTEGLTRRTIDPILHLIKMCLCDAEKHLVPAVLDVRKEHLFEFRDTDPDPKLLELIRAEAIALSEILNNGLGSERGRRPTG